mmetsp:Transcript_31111/g.69121  ORF Transcript_31111/g.69121 Transcript_31111/m.69121 type:complete len:268 (-) Transcript_31111:124-927(-)
MGGHHAVVVVVVEVVGLGLGHSDLRQPLDHAAADEAGDNDADGEAMVGSQPAPVLLVGHYNVRGQVHSLGVGEGGAVGAVITLGQLTLGTSEGHEVGSLIWSLDASLQQNITQPDASPVCGTGGAGSPVEANRLLHHILLLATVARTDQGDGQSDGRHGDQLIHTNADWGVNQAIDFNSVAAPADFGHGTVIAYEVNGRWRYEAIAHEMIHRWLAVERVSASKAQDAGVTRYPVVWCISILLVDVDRWDMQLPIVLSDCKRSFKRSP